MRRKDREVRNLDWIWSVIAEGQLMHLALIDKEGRPYALSVHYGYERSAGCLYFHGAMAGRKVEALRAHPGVAFNIFAGHVNLPRPGNPKRLWGVYRSVMGTGTVTTVSGPAEKLRIILKMKEHYGDTDANYAVSETRLQTVVNIFSLKIDELTGKVKGYPNPDNPDASYVRER